MLHGELVRGERMKRYLTFCGYDYYPAGGWDDFRGDFESLELAKAHCDDSKREDLVDWCQIVDTGTRRVRYWAKSRNDAGWLNETF